MRTNRRIQGSSSARADEIALPRAVAALAIGTRLEHSRSMITTATPSSEPVGSDLWLDDYAADFVTIVDRFKDRVRV